MSDIEDLAAQVGIEILPGSSDGQLAISKASQSANGDVLASTKNAEPAECQQTFSAEILSRCTEEQLGEFQTIFKHRFTEDDEEFARTLSTPTHPPPSIVDWGWGNRHFDRSRGQRDSYNNWGRRTYRGHNSLQRSPGFHQYRQSRYHDDRWGRPSHSSDGGGWHRRDRSPTRRN